MIKLLNYLYRLIFPRICCGCGGLLYNPLILCFDCLQSLPYTNFQNYKNNMVFKAICHKIEVNYACSIFFFENQSTLRNMIHHLKYYDRPEIGFFLGQKMGKVLQQSADYDDVDYLVPIPLHPKKMSKRGYNQSEILAQGIASIFNKPILNNLVIRKKNTNAQASLSTFEERKKNVRDAFGVTSLLQAYVNEHLLLIDDVLTTGSTMVSCIEVLKQYGAKNISVCTLAYTIH